MISGGDARLLRIYYYAMIEREKLKDFVNEALADTDCFLTDLTVSADNDIVVEIDSDGSIDIDFCSALSRRI